ncbi:MAG: DUF3568 family protein [Nitrospinota bacterium]
MDLRGSVKWLCLCAALGLALPGCTALLVGGAVAGTAAGVHYTITNVAYKVFAHPLPRVERAARAALRHMKIEHASPLRTGKESEIQARTAGHDISITLEQVTPTTTKMSVDAVKRQRIKFFKDKALATEIIIQTGKRLGRPGRKEKGKGPRAGGPSPLGALARARPPATGMRGGQPGGSVPVSTPPALFAFITLEKSA